MLGKLNRRHVLMGGAAVAATNLIGSPLIAQDKPEKLVFLCVTGSWGDVMYKQAIPAWEQETGIKIEYTLLAADSLGTRLRTELLADSKAVDIAMWSPPWAGWLEPHMADHDALLKEYGSTPDDTDWNNLYGPAVKMATFNGKKIGLPYRVNAHVLYYQPALLQRLGIAKPPETFSELRDAAKAITTDGAGKRYGVAYGAKVSPFLVNGFGPYLYSSGGDYYDTKTYEILINNDAAVNALEFYSGLLRSDKVVPPEVITWTQDEVIVGAQSDRFGLSMLIGPWAAQINGNGDADKGKWATVGDWGYAKLPGSTSPDGGRSSVSGWIFGVPDNTPNKEWAFRFLQYVMNKKWLVKSIETGNMPPTTSVQTDPSIAASYPWAVATAGSLPTAVLEPRDSIWGQLTATLATNISQVLAGQAEPKAALDAVATDWERQMKRAKLK